MFSQKGKLKRIHGVPTATPFSQGPGFPQPAAAAGKAGQPLIDAAQLEALAQKRLEQTSTSLEAALRVVENKLSQESLDR